MTSIAGAGVTKIGVGFEQVCNSVLLCSVPRDYLCSMHQARSGSFPLASAHQCWALAVRAFLGNESRGDRSLFFGHCLWGPFLAISAIPYAAEPITLTGSPIYPDGVSDPVQPSPRASSKR